MPFVLLALGLLFFVVALQGTQGAFFSLLKSEFVGTNSFIVWGAAFVILGLLGYIRPIRPITHAFMVLILIVLVVANGGGFFKQFNSAIRSPEAPPAPAPTPATQSGSTTPALNTPLLGTTGNSVPQIGGWGTGPAIGLTTPGTGYVDTTSTF